MESGKVVIGNHFVGNSLADSSLDPVQIVSTGIIIEEGFQKLNGGIIVKHLSCLSRIEMGLGYATQIWHIRSRQLDTDDVDCEKIIEGGDNFCFSFIRQSVQGRFQGIVGIIEPFLYMSLHSTQSLVRKEDLGSFKPQTSPTDDHLVTHRLTWLIS